MAAKPIRCECCGGPPGSKGMCLDHDKRTNKIRGWLCQKCNTGIGLLGDDVAGLERAIAYLQKDPPWTS
jgi:hypothetical protein